MFLDLGQAIFEFFKTPGGFASAATEAIADAQIEHILEIFFTDISDETADGGIGLVFVKSELMITNQSDQFVFVFFG